jgi:predicted nucleic acid-binding protein
MSGRYLLDTNIIIALFAGEKGVLEAVNQADEFLVPTTVVGELYYGAQKSGKRQLNIARIDGFAESNVILACDKETARWSYPEPIPECPKIEGLLCFYNEKVDLYVDGELQERPRTYWS